MSHKKRLGQFFTPPAVAQAIVNLLKPLLPQNPTVADLSCGEAILLSTLLENGITTGDRIWGIDIDPKMDGVWKRISSLSKSHLFIEDGLTFDPKNLGFPNDGIDLGIGNPPYNRAHHLITNPDILRKFKLGRLPLKPSKEDVLNVEQLGFDFDEPDKFIKVKLFDTVETVVSQPIEALFIEKFIQVVRPGGLIALILPEGLFSNSGSQDVRDYLVDEVEILALIGLPRRVFDNDAKTDILLLRKKIISIQPQKEPVFLATVSQTIRNGDYPELLEVINVFHKGIVKEKQ